MGVAVLWSYPKKKELSVLWGNVGYGPREDVGLRSSQKRKGKIPVVLHKETKSFLET